MISGVFNKSEYDMDGITFRVTFESSPSAQLIDVRTPNEYRSGFIKTAINLDIMSSEFERQLSQLNNDHAYFIYCRSGARSAAAVKLMRGKGLQAYNLIGGIGAWPQ